jgi:nicotinamidase-related amidase/type 1 glutamine amidotransferase
LLCGTAALPAPPQAEAALRWKLRTRVETGKGTGRYHTLTRDEEWDARRTALIICDVWDLHHCLNAVRRVEELAPRLERFVKAARDRGVTIIHAPSDCMDAYKDHPARRHATAVPRAPDLPKDIASWCSRIPAEERGRYPIDQSDGGEDDDPAEHRAWAARLKETGRNPRAPWKKQTDLLTVEPGDYVSDKGDEIWSILQHRGIDNVLLAGVHTNMCVLGRPFGLRQMARNGKKVVLVRDLTDTMYNPQRWPYVSHFTGTDLIVEHVEKFVCPTLSSDQLLGGRPLRFKHDTRPTVALILAEEEYETFKTLPAFVARFLGKDFRVNCIFCREDDHNDLPGLEALDEADVLLLSAHRRLLRPEQLAAVRRFVQAGKPVVGVRTASHAFVPRQGPVPAGRAAWPEFDRQVFGGNYHGHHGNTGPRGPKTFVKTDGAAAGNPLLSGLPSEEFVVRSWLYKTAPLADGAKVLLMGRVADRVPHEPVAWTFSRADGGRSFYTSLGHPEDFSLPAFQRLLLNAVYWAAGLSVPREVRIEPDKGAYRRHWNLMPVPSAWAQGSHGVLKDFAGTAWYRCLVRVPAEWAGRDLHLALGEVRGTPQVFFNGHKLDSSPPDIPIAADRVDAGTLNLLAVRLSAGEDGGLLGEPEVRCGEERIGLRGAWQFRTGDDPSWSRYELPAQFAAATDVIFEPHTRRAR